MAWIGERQQRITAERASPGGPVSYVFADISRRLGGVDVSANAGIVPGRRRVEMADEDMDQVAGINLADCTLTVHGCHPNLAACGTPAHDQR